MPDFTDPEEMLAAIQERVHGALHSLQPAYEKVGELIKREAQARIGHYQGEEGPFEPWAKLSPATIAEREKLGYSGEEPLLRTGTLRDSIEIAATEEGVVVGVPSKEVTVQDGNSTRTVNIGDIADYLEKGTPDIPPRSFLGAAFFHERENAVIIVNEAIGKRLREE